MSFERFFELLVSWPYRKLWYFYLQQGTRYFNFVLSDQVSKECVQFKCRRYFTKDTKWCKKRRMKIPTPDFLIWNITFSKIKTWKFPRERERENVELKTRVSKVFSKTLNLFLLSLSRLVYKSLGVRHHNQEIPGSILAT